MSERIEPEDMAAHDVEIERGTSLPDCVPPARASCSCGYLGKWRAGNSARRMAVRDGERHQDRRAAGEA